MDPTAPQPARILVRGVNWLGDAVMTTPALVRLRERFPSAEVTLLCHEKLADLWTGHPAVDRVRTFRSKDSPWTTGRSLRRDRFDLAVLFPNSFRSGLEAFVARIPVRIGTSRGLRRLLLTRPVEPDPNATPMRKRSLAEIRRLQSEPDRPPTVLPSASHQIHHYLRLVAAAGASSEPLAPVLGMPPRELAAARSELFPDDPGFPVLGLNAGAEYGAAKRWPVERFAEAANRLFATTGCRVLVFGGPSDQQLAQQLAARIHRAPTTVLAGRTSLRQLLSKLACCDLLLTNDTGPMHVAAALGVSVVVPFGSTNPDLTGPGAPGDSHHALLRSPVACAPCFLRTCPAEFRCMERIGVDAVVQAAERILFRGTDPLATRRTPPLQPGTGS